MTPNKPSAGGRIVPLERRLRASGLDLDTLEGFTFDAALRLAVALPDPDRGDAVADLTRELVIEAAAVADERRRAAAAGLLAAESAIRRACAVAAAALTEDA